MIIALITLICLVFMITGILIKNAILLLSAFITWIIFAVLMNEYTFTNAAVGTGLLAFGGIMAFICAFLALGIWASKRHDVPEIDEQESYKRQVLRVTKRKR